MKTPGEWMPRSKAISDAKTRQQLTQPTRSAVRATNGRGRGGSAPVDAQDAVSHTAHGLLQQAQLKKT